MDRLEEQLYAYINRHHKDGDTSTSRRRNVSPKVWGPPGWKFIDKVVDGYPEKPSRREKIAMLEFLTSFGHVLPCKECRENHVTFSLDHPPKNYVSSRRQVKRWISMYKRMRR